MIRKTFVLVLLCTFFKTVGFAFDFRYKGITFKCKLKGGVVCITGFDTNAKNVTIPASVSDRGLEYEVWSIDLWKGGINYMADTIIIEEGIRHIASRAFVGFHRLKYAHLPLSIAEIGSNCLRNKKMEIHGLEDKFIEEIRNGRACYPSASFRKPIDHIAQVYPSEK